MGLRCHRCTRLHLLRFNFSAAGLRPVSIGGRGGSFTIPVSRSGGPRSTVELYGARAGVGALNTHLVGPQRSQQLRPRGCPTATG